MTKATFIFGAQIKGESKNLTYANLPHNSQGKEWLTYLNAYTHGRYDTWGGRDERGEPLRCFMVFNKNDQNLTQPLGYVNIGINSFQVKTIEFGITFKENVSTENISEAAVSVLKNYVVQTRDEQGRLTEYKKVFGTLSPSPTNLLTDKLLANGELIKAGLKVSTNFEEFIKVFTENGISPRFKAGDHGELLEKIGDNTYAPKVFFLYDLPEVVFAGHTESTDPLE